MVYPHRQELGLGFQMT